MPTVASTVPVRHGICRLTLTIGGTHYRLRPTATPPPGTKVWILRALNGPRPGATYSVATAEGSAGCTCPDHERNGAKCKHIMALRALCLIPRGRKRDQEKRERKVASRKRDEPKRQTKAPGRKALRLHAPAARAIVGDVEAKEFATGFNAAVREHIAGMNGGAI